MSDRLCPVCKAWIFAADDAFCGRCGRPCADLRLEAFPSVLLAGYHAPDVIFKLTNRSVAEVKVDALPPPPWLTWIRPPSGVLAPGGTATYAAKAATRALTQPAAGEVSLVTNAGNVTIPILAIQTDPKMQPVQDQIEFWMDGANTAKQMTIQAAPTAGSLRILSLGSSDQAWLQVSPMAKPFVASATNPVPLTMEIDSSRMARSRLVPGSRLAVRIDMEYEGPHGPAAIPLPLTIVIRNRPAITWREEHAPPSPLVAMAHQKLNLTFANLSHDDGGLRNAPLHIEELSLQPAGGLHCAIHRNSILPADVPGGETLNCEFELNLEGVAPNLYHFPLLVRSNGPQSAKSFLVPVNVRAVPDFDGVIAIDFGTSNTCCALLESGGSERDLESVALDGNRTTCPTLVRYIDMDRPLPEIETGVAIKNLAAASDEVAASSVERLKQQLGAETCLISVRPKNSQEWRQREVRAAAADYLRHIREVAEWQKQAHFHEFILTHPAVCSLRQYRNLRLAIEEAFGTHVHIDFLQEPVAALIPFFAEMATKAVAAYTVASFDLGGGTTDITLVSVTHTRDAAGNLEIKPQIVTSWGEQFGGEDLTDFLVKEIAVRCQKVLSRERPGFQLADRQVKGSATPDVLRNRAALRESAEQLKARLSEDPAVGPERFRGLLLRAVCTSQDPPIEDVRFDAAKLDQEGDASLEVVFLSYLRTRISQLALRLKQSAQAIPSLDHIHLSGKTTFLPVVRQVLQLQFGGAQIHRAGDPKECVVRGACMVRSMSRHGRARRLNLGAAPRRTTSSVGLLDDDTQVFRPIIPLDSPIPDAGLDKVLPNAATWGDPIVIWENLGFELERVRPDGSLNPLLKKLGIWEPASPAVLAPGAPCMLRLRLTTDFKLFAALIDPDNHVIPLKPRGSQGGL